MFNKIHILPKQLQRKDLTPGERVGVTELLRQEIDVHRQSWRRIVEALTHELKAVLDVMNVERQAIATIKDKKSLEARRRRVRVEDWEQAEKTYRNYRQALLNQLSLSVEQLQPGKIRIENLIPPRVMGDGKAFRRGALSCFTQPDRFLS